MLILNLPCCFTLCYNNLGLFSSQKCTHKSQTLWEHKNTCNTQWSSGCSGHMGSCSFEAGGSYSSCRGSNIFLDCPASVGYYWPGHDLQKCNQIEKPDLGRVETHRTLTSSESQHIYYFTFRVIWIFLGKGKTLIKTIIFYYNKCESKVKLKQKYLSSPVWSC